MIVMYRCRSHLRHSSPLIRMTVKIISMAIILLDDRRLDVLMLFVCSIVITINSSVLLYFILKYFPELCNVLK